jgi:hypothetical protein
LPSADAPFVEAFLRIFTGIGGIGGGGWKVSMSCSLNGRAEVGGFPSDVTRALFFAAPLAARFTLSLALLLFCAAAAPPGFPSFPSRVGFPCFFFFGVVGSEADAEAAAKLANSSAFNLRGRMANSFLSFLLPEGADGTLRTSPSGP